MQIGFYFGAEYNEREWIWEWILERLTQTMSLCGNMDVDVPMNEWFRLQLNCQVACRIPSNKNGAVKRSHTYKHIHTHGRAIAVLVHLICMCHASQIHGEFHVL